jgi:uncharacterized protein
MNTESLTVEVCAALSLLLRAMVSNPDAVTIVALPAPADYTRIQIAVAKGSDTGKVIGRQGRTARSLRIVLQAIAKEHGQKYQLDINGVQVDAPTES